MLDLLEDLQHRHPIATCDIGGSIWGWIDTGGPGLPIVLLHGSAADALMFVRPLARFGAGRRMVSVTIPALWNPERIADGLDGLLRHLGVERAVVVGSSLGAWLAPFFARRRPEAVAGLLLGNGFVDASDLAGQPLFDRARLEAISPAELHREWSARIDAAPASPLQVLQQTMIRRKSPEALKAHFLAVVRAVACGPIDVPGDRIVVLDCADDPVIPPPVRDRVAAAFPGARRVTLATGGHYPHVLNPAAYEPVLASLLEAD